MVDPCPLGMGVTELLVADDEEEDDVDSKAWRSCADIAAEESAGPKSFLGVGRSGFGEDALLMLR